MLNNENRNPDRVNSAKGGKSMCLCCRPTGRFSSSSTQRMPSPACSDPYRWHCGDTGRLQHPRPASPSKPQGQDSPRHRFRGALPGEKNLVGKASSSAGTWEKGSVGVWSVRQEAGAAVPALLLLSCSQSHFTSLNLLCLSENWVFIHSNY